MILVFADIAAPAANEPQVKFEDVTASTGLNSNGRCAAWVDMIADGRIWRNDEGKYFTNVTSDAVAVGVFQQNSDELAENVAIVRQILGCQ
jgi:hypothetical protein